MHHDTGTGRTGGGQTATPLKRRCGESVVLENGVTLRVVGISDGSVRLAIEGHPDVSVELSADVTAATCDCVQPHTGS